MDEAARNARDDATSNKSLPQHMRKADPSDAREAPSEPKPEPTARRKEELFETASARGKSREEAMKEAGIQKTTAYDIMKRRKLRAEKRSPSN